MNNYMDLLMKQEDLDPELAEHFTQGRLGTLLQHPLVYGIPYLEQMNAVYNNQLEQKKKLIERARGAKNWHHIIMLYERPYRFNALEEFIDHPEVTDQQYWEMLADVWADSENLCQIDNLADFLNADRKGREHMMTDDERKLLAQLPDQFMIYRGHQEINLEGHSWSLSHHKAHWFATRWNKTGEVAQAVCHKEWVVALLLGRSEYEIIVEDPSILDIQPFVPLKRLGNLAKFHEVAIEQFELGTISDHGPAHWEKVEYNVLALTKGMSKRDIITCRLFAIFHDCKRQNEFTDPDHGRRAADYIEANHKTAIVRMIGSGRFERLLEACRHHNEHTISDDPLIGRCWDADRLDIIRVGIIPDPQLFSTRDGKRLIFNI